MRAGVAVPAHNRHPRLRQSEFRPNHVHDPLFGRIYVEQPYAELLAVFLQSFDLPRCDRVGDRCSARFRGNIVVYRGYRPLGLTYFSTRSPQPLKCLRRSDFVNKVKVNVDDWRPTGRFGHRVGIPDFLK